MLTEEQQDDGACKLRIFTTGSIDITSWYKVWEAAVAVYHLCARRGLAGYATRLGELYFTEECANKRSDQP